MRFAFLFTLALSLFGWNPQEDVNVNSRYTVESVNVLGAAVSKLSTDIRHEMDAVIGQKLDNSVLDRLATRIRRDLRVPNVSVRIKRGQAPDHVTVEFEVEGGRRTEFDVAVPKFAYHSRQGWTAIGDATTRIGDNHFKVALASDGDELVEYFSGFRARYDRASLGTKRVRLGFEVDSYHQQWNNATTDALAKEPGVIGIYRSRENFEPTATVVIAQPLTWTFGVSFQRLEMMTPGAPTEAANAIENTLRFHKDWEQTEGRQAVDAAYHLRAATRTLGSDFVYVRHTAKARYELVKGRNDLSLEFLAGGLNGRAPLFERLVLGNASTLRGWNKYDLDPVGGDRIVHGSIDYRYRFVTVFYDTGVVWNGSTTTGQKHGAGFGFRSDGKEGFLLAIAFPLRFGHVDPVFIAGFNF